MRKMLEFSALVLAAWLILGLAGCSDGGGSSGGGGGGENTTISFESFSPPSIYVDNKSGERLVAFKESLNPTNLISGIPAYATNHGLAKSNSLFNKTGDFALILITEAQYNQNKNNIVAADVFAEIYAFYNHEATNNNRYQISSKSGGSGRIILKNNQTSWNIEIHKDGPTGEVLGYIAAQTTNTVLRVNAPDTYRLYPVFKKYVASEKEIYEVIPKYTEDGGLAAQPYSKVFVLDANGTTTWDLSELVEIVDLTLPLSSFYLRIVNNSGTSIMVFRGEEVLLTSTGLSSTAQGSTNVYSIRLTRNPDGTYPASQEISGLKIGTSAMMVSVPSNTYGGGYVYTITVTGTHESNLTLGEIQESENPLNVEVLTL